MEERSNILREMKICRFCLNEQEPLSNIYEKDAKQTIPLPLQIMSCVAIEVFPNDGMPQLICKTCRTLTQQAYCFKTSCKRSDDALKLFVATGSLVKPNIVNFTLIDDEAEVSENEKPASKKRSLQEPQPSPFPKISKTSSSEFVTLNYTTNIDLSGKNSAIITSAEVTHHDRTEGEQIIELGDVQPLEEVVDQDPFDDIHMNMVEKNPVFEVPQVKTDVFPCPHCERSFPLEQLLDIHVKNHIRDRGFSCEECGRRFFTKYDLGKHIQTHSDLKPFTCVVCNKQFARESLLHRHEKIHNDVPKYLCSFCDRTFLTSDDLDIHAEKHKKKRPFACRLCNKSFVFKQGLERHELTHADQKPHKCNYCEASFTSPIKLTRHITSHAGLRPYPCKQCGRTFLLSHHLTRHMRSHFAAKSSHVSAVGQHKCDVCSMSFRRKDSLINHSAIHSMVNLKCVICNTSFETAKMVKEHITTHLSGLPYPCDKCDYSFDTQDQLEEHELKHAEMEYEEQIEKEVNMEQLANEEDYESDDESITEFTITNSENPEVVRRSKREPKIKNYAQFLKDELGSDVEDQVVDEELQDEEEEEIIKPVIRTEGTRVYFRKNITEKPKVVPILKPEDVQTAPLEEITQPTQPNLSLLDNLGIGNQAVQALNNKKFVDMKIGDKTVRVQKLILTKAEIEVMARQGKIEMKGNTILLKNNKSSLHEGATKAVSHNTIPTVPKSVIKKTYVRKPNLLRNVSQPKQQPSTSSVGTSEQNVSIDSKLSASEATEVENDA